MLKSTDNSPPTEFYNAHYYVLFQEIQQRDDGTNPHRGNPEAALKWDLVLLTALFEALQPTARISRKS